MSVGTNTGHGHVWQRPDGVRARCGGPALCKECLRDAALVDKTAPRPLTPSTLYTYMTKYPVFGADVIRLLEAGQKLANSPTNYELAGPIIRHAAALGAALELHRSLEQ